MSGCTFELTRNSPLRTTLLDEITGHAKYQIDTPLRIVNSVTRIRKFDVPPQAPLIRGGKTNPDHNDDPANVGKKRSFRWKLSGKEVPETEDEFARIRWKCFSPDRINFRGNLTNRKEFLPRTGKRNRHFKFTGPDGVEYKWELGAMGMTLPKLVTTDGKETEIVKFHRARLLPKKKKARLVIHPAGMEMLDYIVLTFVFVEYRRRQREAAAKSGGG